MGINGQDINKELPFLYNLYTYIPGETIVFDVVRGDTSLNIPISL